MKFRLVEEYDNIQAQIEQVFAISSSPIMWSTFILPNGKFVDLGMEGDADSGEHCILSKILKSKFKSDANAYLEDKCIKINVNYPYLVFPRKKPTSEQFASVEKWLDIYTDNIDTYMHYIVSADDVADSSILIDCQSDSKIYNLEQYYASDIIKFVRRYYSIGVLEEKLIKNNT